MDSTMKKLCLHDEMFSSFNLINAGLGELQEIDGGNDFYHLPQQLLASGLERLMKCYIILVYEARNSEFPDSAYIKKLGHDLTDISSTISEEYFNKNDIPALEDDYELLKKDQFLKDIIHILSEFGKFARYYNIDVVTGNQQISIDPKKEWQALERRIEEHNPFFKTKNTEISYMEYHPRINCFIIQKIERFIRAITRQFTLGEHGGMLKQYSCQFHSFITLRDDQLGTIDYRHSVKVLEKQKEKWEKRTEKQILKSKWPTRKIQKDQYNGEWPFRSNEVTVELRDELFCILYIEGYCFAMNGAARSRYNYPFPDDAGIAILGKPTWPFLDIAFELKKR